MVMAVIAKQLLMGDFATDQSPLELAGGLAVVPAR